MDQGFFNLFNLVVFDNQANKLAKYILISTVASRVISASLNFVLNKNFVFKLKGHTGGSLWKYIVLAVGLMLLSASGVWLLSRIGMNSTIAKLIVDFILYFVSFQAQQKWVFNGKRGGMT